MYRNVNFLNKKINIFHIKKSRFKEIHSYVKTRESYNMVNIIKKLHQFTPNVAHFIFASK